VLNQKSSIVIAIVVAGAYHAASVQAAVTESTRSTAEAQSSRPDESGGTKKAELEQATFGLGCYSCAEAIFERLKGVKSVAVGYSGGSVKNPTDEQIGSGKSGHAEVVHLEYDPKVISYDELLEVFWKMHDPTTLNRQGKNAGSQYRSVIFYHTDKQRDLANQYKEKLGAAHAYNAPIVTEVAAYTEFYPAAKSHQAFFRLNPKAEYCTLVIQPKVDEFKKVFGDKMQTPQPAAKSEP
jgi:peptide-methionine (S)-S-oxide reductase